MFGYCNLGSFKDTTGATKENPFAAGGEGLQVALLAPEAGRIRHETPRGGLLEMFDNVFVWSPEFVIGALEVDGSNVTEPIDAGLLMLAGRSRTGLIEQRFAPLSGWHDRTRAWRPDREGEFGSILGQGLCQLSSMIQGAGRTYVEFAEQAGGPAHMVYGYQPPTTPSVALLLDQIRRTPAQNVAIAEDLIGGVTGDAAALSPPDLIYTASLLAALTSPSLLSETYPILTRAGLSRVGPPDAVLLAAFADSPLTYRHKALGYRLELLPWHEGQAGPAIRDWFARSFEPVRRSLDDIRSDYVALIDEMRARARPGRPTRLLLMNACSTAGREDVQSYIGFDAPLGATLEMIHAKDVNLMLCDLARERDIAIVDLDAIAAEMGASEHMPDSTHPTTALVAEGRAEIVRILRELGTPGFI